MKQKILIFLLSFFVSFIGILLKVPTINFISLPIYMS